MQKSIPGLTGPLLAAQYATQVFAEPVWAVPGLVPGTGFTLLYSLPKVGKTTLAIQLAHSLATNTPFLGLFPPAPGPWNVLYVQSDELPAEWAAQLKQLDLLGPFSTVWRAPGLLLHDLAGLAEVVKPYNFLIWDSLFTVTGYDDVVDPYRAGQLLKLLDLVNAGRPSLLLHHQRKGSAGVPEHITTGASGASLWTARASSLLRLTESRLIARGRLVKPVELVLQRGPSGTWVSGEKKFTW